MEANLEIEVVCNGVAETYTFSDFPVRIGRDESCELFLPHAFVSRKHARIERGVPDGFVLVDEGGRNGVAVAGVKVKPGACVELADGAVFEIETLVATVRARVNEQATSLYSEQEVVPAFLAQASAVMQEYRAARAVALAVLSNSLAAIAEPQRSTMARELASVHKELATDPGFRSLIAKNATEESAIPAEAAALRELQKLAAAYVPDALPPATATDVAAFVGALDGALRTFLMTKAELDAVYQPQALGDSAPGVERARRLGSELLDWRGSSARAAIRVERELMDIVSQHVGLVADVEAGVRAIVDELSPAAIEFAAKASRWQSAFGSRSLWRELARRHASVASTLHERLGSRFSRVSAAMRSPRLVSARPMIPMSPDDPALHPPFAKTLRLEVRAFPGSLTSISGVKSPATSGTADASN